MMAVTAVRSLARANRKPVWVDTGLQNVSLGDVVRTKIDGPSSLSDPLYRHAPFILSDGSDLYATWHEHDTTEEGSGQYTRWGYSTDDGTTWTVGGILHASRDNYARTSTSVRSEGAVNVNSALEIVDNRLFSLATACSSRSSNHVGGGMFAREILRQTKTLSESEFGLRSTNPSEFSIANQWPPNASSQQYAAIAARLKSKLDMPHYKPAYDQFEGDQDDHDGGNSNERRSVWPFASDNPASSYANGWSYFSELSSVQRNDGTILRVWRCNATVGGYNNTYLYRSEIDSVAGFQSSAPVITNIRNAPGRPYVGKTPSGRFMLVGNFELVNGAASGERQNLNILFSRNGYEWSHQAAIPGIKTAPSYRYMDSVNLDYRHGRIAYPHACNHDGKIYIIVSEQKEDIVVYSFEEPVF